MSARGGWCAATGAAGIDRTTIDDVEQHGVDRLLDELAADLKDGSYRSLPARRVFIAKSASRERRPLSIPAVRDRVVQAALKIVIEPIFEADFLPCSFGFRPRRSAHDALQVLVDEAWRGRRWVVETDISSCFEAIPHDRLMAAVEERVSAFARALSTATAEPTSGRRISATAAESRRAPAKRGSRQRRRHDPHGAVAKLAVINSTGPPGSELATAANALAKLTIG